jgi:hypothetical protein
MSSRRSGVDRPFSRSQEAVGAYQGTVVSINDNGRLSVKVHRLVPNHVFTDVRFHGPRPYIGDVVWVTFIEGRTDNLLALTGSGTSDLASTSMPMQTLITGSAWYPLEIPFISPYGDMPIAGDDSDPATTTSSERMGDIFIPCNPGEVLEITPDWYILMPYWTAFPILFRYAVMKRGYATGTLVSSHAWQAAPTPDNADGPTAHTHGAYVRVTGMGKLLVAEDDMEMGGIRLRPQAINFNTPIKGTSVLTISTTPLDGDTVTMDYKTYTFRTSIASNVNGEVLIGGSETVAQTNLKAAVELTGDSITTGPGYQYAVAMTHSRGFVAVADIVHETVTIGTWAANAATVSAILGSVTNEQMDTTESTSNVRMSWSDDTLQGGEAVAFVNGGFFSTRGPNTNVSVKRRRHGTNIVVLGQSLNHTPYDDSYGYQLWETMYNKGHQVGFDNYAWSGSTHASRLGIIQELGEGATGYEKSILILTGGFSDAVSGDTAQDIYDWKSALATTARGYGFDTVIALTMPEAKWITGAAADEYYGHNPLLLADADGAFDAVVDIDPLLVNNWPSETDLFPDGVHFADPAAQIVAKAIAAIIDPFMWQPS